MVKKSMHVHLWAHTHTYHNHSKCPDGIVGQDLGVNNGDGQLPKTDATGLRPVLVTLGLRTQMENSGFQSKPNSECVI